MLFLFGTSARVPLSLACERVLRGGGTTGCGGLADRSLLPALLACVCLGGGAASRLVLQPSQRGG